MRILITNDGLGDPGGVHSYLVDVIAALRARGHEIALLHLAGAVGPAGSPAADVPHFDLPPGRVGAAATALAWQPDIAFSHNMSVLDVDRLLCRHMPVVKMMHGYFGTCVSGLKTHLFPTPRACGRRFGAACLPMYATRRCGPMNPIAIGRAYQWAQQQNDLFAQYAAMVVASRHMRAEFVANGADARRVHCLPLFPSGDRLLTSRPPQDTLAVLFLGRMTALKGGDVLIRAAAEAAGRALRPIHLTLAGDGPHRTRWQALARKLGVTAEFPGWVDEAGRSTLLARASLLAVPSVWPEPFGLVGLEAAAAAVPAVAFDRGGIRDWLTDGENGYLVDATSPVTSLANALVRAANDPAGLARLAGGARHAAERLSRHRHVDALETLLQSVVDASLAGTR